MKDIVVPCGSPGDAGSAGKKRALWLARGAALAAFVGVTAAATPDACAQYYGTGEALLPLFIAGVVLEGGTVVGGLVTGIGSSVHVAKGDVRRGWFVSSYVFGGLNLAMTLLWGTLAAENQDMVAPWAALSATHGSIAALDLAMPSIGFARGQAPRQAGLRPIVVGGRDIGGRRWNGAGVQLVGF